MNLQAKKPHRPDAMERLFRLWGLTPANEALARAYLTSEPENDALLSGAERQVFQHFDWQDQREICAALQEITAPEYTRNQEKVLKLRWAVGRSTAGFAALFDQQRILLDDEERAVFLRARNSHVGTAAKHASIAEYHMATGLEAVFGYLYLTGRSDRLERLLGAAEEICAD